MDYLEIKAPAKINIGLFITSKRPDGYHNLQTIFYPINDLYDEISFTRCSSTDFSSNDKSIEADNLIIKAKELLERQSNKQLNVRIELKKNIPIGAGMGGGSSDAAAALISLNEMFNLNFTVEMLRKFALSLGSDVPFFVKPKPSFAESRGEDLTLLNLDLPYPILIVNPKIHISTKEAYSNITPRTPRFDLREIEGINLNNPDELINNITNDFEEYVFNKYPEIEQIKDSLYRCGARFALMTGSGSTVFGIFSTVEEAERARNNFPMQYFTHISLE